MVLDIIRRRGKLVIITGVALFIACAAVRMFIVHQVFTATVSISLQQSAPVPSANLLALAGGGPSVAKKYQGIIRSRKLAREVESRVHYRSALGLDSQEAAIDMIQTGVTSDDNGTDNLIYIRAAVPGPPPFMPGAQRERNIARNMAAMVGNAYAAALRNYIENDDNDRELVLLRAADQQLAFVRENYETIARRFANFATHSKSADATLVTGGSSGSGGGSGGGMVQNELSALYIRRGEIQEQIADAEAKKQHMASLVSGQLSDLAKLPTEDPLLMAARKDYTDADIHLKQLQVSFTPQSPQVAAAQEALKIAERRLKKEVEGVRKNLRTEAVQAEAWLNGLRAQAAACDQEIAKAEQRHSSGLKSVLGLERLRNETMVALEALKTAAAQSTLIKIQTGSAQSRAAVIDPATPPRPNRETMSILGTGLIGALIGLTVLIAADYALVVRETFPHAVAGRK